MAQEFLFDRDPTIAERSLSQMAALEAPLTTQPFAQALTEVMEMPVASGDVFYGTALAGKQQARDRLAAGLAENMALQDVARQAQSEQIQKQQILNRIEQERAFQDALATFDRGIGRSIARTGASFVKGMGDIDADLIERTGKGIADTLRDKAKELRAAAEQRRAEQALADRDPIPVTTMEEALANKLRAEQRILGGVDTASLATPRGATEGELQALGSLPYSEPRGQSFQSPMIPRTDDEGALVFDVPVTQRNVMELQIARIRADQQGLKGDERLRFLTDNVSDLGIGEVSYLNDVIPEPGSENVTPNVFLTPGEAQVLEPTEPAVAPQAPGRAISSREAMEVLSLLRSRMGM